MLKLRLLAATAGLAFASAALAQVNDPCAGAIAVLSGSATPFDTTASTNDGSSSCGGGANDIWYSYTATATGVLTVSCCGANYDSVISLIAGGCGGTELSCNDDNCGFTLQSSTSATVNFGDVVLIRVAGFLGSTGSGILSVNLAPQVNDACAGAIAVGDGSVTAFDTRGTTTDGSLPTCVFNPGNNLWYSFTAPSAGTLTASLCGSSFDTALSLYADSCAGAEIACNDDDCFLQSTVSGPIASGQTVLIQVGGFNLQSGTGSLAVNFTASGAPNNDNCAQAIAVSNGTPVSFDTTNATTDGPENCGFNNAKDLWYSYTSGCADTITASTCGSSFDTVVTIYDGCGGAVLACNDDACGLQSSASAGISAGQTVIIQVSGYFGSSGSGTLVVSQAGIANDACASATAVTSGSNTPFDTTCATTDGASNCGFSNDNDVWYSFSSASAGTLSVSTCGAANFDTVLTVYADSCGGAVLACNDDNCSLQSSLNAPVAAGQTVLIQLAGYNGQFGSGTVAVNFVPTCTADFNNDSTVDFFDYLDFVDAFSANDPSADFNNDGSIDFFDYLDFVDAFSAGC